MDSTSADDLFSSVPSAGLDDFDLGNLDGISSTLNSNDLLPSLPEVASSSNPVVNPDSAVSTNSAVDSGVGSVSQPLTPGAQKLNGPITPPQSSDNGNGFSGQNGWGQNPQNGYSGPMNLKNGQSGQRMVQNGQKRSKTVKNPQNYVKIDRI